jgi:serpin B
VILQTPDDKFRQQEKKHVSKTKATPTAAFGLALLKKEVAAKPGENVMISPLSVSIALGMTANGAKGTTLSGINTALHLKGDQATNNKGYAALLEKLKRTGIGVTLDIANGLFARIGVGFKAGFLNTNKKFFGAKIDELDFDDPKTVATINGFVSKATNKKINELLKDKIAADTVMFIINCVYFKGEWTTKFDKRNTKDLDFAGVGKRATMYRKGAMAYDKDVTGDTYEVMALPFGKSQAVRALVFLPKAGKTTDDVLAKLDEKSLLGHAACEHTSRGELWLPRLQTKYGNKLNASLEALGMVDAFGAADFSGMRKTPPALFIKAVQHMTDFAWDEEGAEGAAVTSVEVGFECVQIPYKMKVDRPFLAFVIDTETEAVLFAGVITDPAKPRK